MADHDVFELGDVPLQSGDVLTHLGPLPSDNVGSVQSEPSDTRAGCLFLVSELAEDGKVPVTVYRNAESVSLEVSSSAS